MQEVSAYHNFRSVVFTAQIAACKLVAPGVAAQFMDSVFRVGYHNQRARNHPHPQKAVMAAFKQG